MAKRSSVRLVALLALLAIGLVILARFFLASDVGTSGESGTAAVDDRLTSMPVSTASESPIAELPVAKALTVTSGPSTQSERAAAATPEDLELSEAVWVTGSVHFPEHTPIDETVEVIASGKKFKHREMYRAPVAADGSFRVAFAKDTRSGRLTIDAAHLYLASPLVIQPAAAPSGNVLEPEVGGRILGLVIPPDDVADADAVLEKAYVVLYAWHHDSQSEPVHLSAKVGADRRFELRGVPPETRCGIHCETKAWSDSNISDVAVVAGEDTSLQLRLRRGVHLAGKVIDEAGQPMGATLIVEVKSEDGSGSNARGDQRTNPKDGSFELAGSEPGTITLSAQKKGYANAKVELGHLVDGDARDAIELRLTGGGFVSGHVVWPDGHPVERAMVTAAPAVKHEGYDWRPVEDLQFSTAADGSFKITGLTGGPFFVAASAVPRGEDAAGETAKATEAEGDKKPAKKSVARGPKWSTRLENVTLASDSLVLTLQPGYVLSGRVLDDNGAPVKPFQIIATPQEPELASLSSINNSVQGQFTADDGSFTLEGVHAGAWKVRAIAKGYLSGAGEGVAVPARLALGSLVIPRAAVLRGEVRGPDGKLIAKARVEMELPEVDQAPRISFGGDTDVLSNANGRFEFKTAPGGEYTLRASHEGFAESEPLAVNVAPGQTLEGLIFTLRSGGRLTVELFPSAGSKVAGRKIFAYGSFAGGSGNWREANTDSMGRCTLEGLAPGSWEITAEPSEEELKFHGEMKVEDESNLRSSLQKSATVTIVDGESAHVVLGAPPRAPVEVRGVVRSTGAPVAGASVMAYMRSRESVAQPKFTRCDAKGAYRLTLDEPGSYSFSASREAANAGQWRPVEVPAAATFELDMELPSGSISGRVLGPDREPLKQASVQLSMDPKDAQARSDGVGGMAQTDESGAFRFEDLPAGVYMISAIADRYDSALSDTGGIIDHDPAADAFSRESVHGLNLSEGAAMRDVELRLSRGGILQGIVRDAKGKPVGDVFVIVRDASDLLRPESRGQTDGSGHYACRGLGAGTWTAQAIAGDGKGISMESAGVRIVSGEKTALDLELRPGTELCVEVFDRDGKPVGAAIFVRDDRGREQSVVPKGGSVDGTTQTVGPFAPGHYTVTASNHDGVNASASISLSGEATRTIRLTLGGG